MENIPGAKEDNETPVMRIETSRKSAFFHTQISLETQDF